MRSAGPPIRTHAAACAVPMDLPPVNANLPRPSRDWRPFAVGAGVLIAAAAVWVAALSTPRRNAPSARALVIEAASAPVAPSATGEAVRTRKPIVARPSRAQQRADAQLFALHDRAHVPAAWMAGFYPLYVAASKTFGVNWLLLAS